VTRSAPALLVATVGISCATAVAFAFRRLGMYWNGVVLFGGAIAVPFALSAVLILLRAPKRISPYLLAASVAAICAMVAIYVVFVGRSD
jgi:hypothetical protein